MNTNVLIENQQLHNQYLTFILNNEEYGVEILNVVEIRGMTQITPLPTAPLYVKGVINLRGTIVPVLDLRLRFGLPEQTYTELTVVIVLQVEVANRKRMVGIIVDAVSEVYTISGNELKGPPDIVYSVGKEYIKGLVSLSGDNQQKKMIIIIDVVNLFDLERMSDSLDEIGSL